MVLQKIRKGKRLRESKVQYCGRQNYETLKWPHGNP